MRTRRSRAVPMAGGALALVALSGSIAQAADARVDTGLGGYAVDSQAAPFRMLLDDPAIPIPRPPDEAIVEADPAFTSTSLATGPTALALSSILWPGNLLGNGFEQFADGQAYPVKSMASFPGGSPAAEQKPAPGTGIGSTSTASGLDVAAEATGNTPAVPGVDLGAVTSKSTSTVDKDDVAIGSARSQVSDVALAGLVTVKSVVSTVDARSDGGKPTSSGTTAVSGLSVGGMDLAVDDKGVRLAGRSMSAAQSKQALAAIAAIGITISPPTQAVSTVDGVLTREASGLRIVLDSKLVRRTLDDSGALGPIGDLAGGIEFPEIEGLPLQPGGLLFTALATSPKVTFVLGAATASTAANPPIVVPPLPPFAVAPPLDAGATAGTPGTAGTSALAPVGPLPTTDGLAAQSPVLAGPVTNAALSGTSAFAGLSILLLLAAAGIAAYAGKGLRGVQAAALGGLVIGCPLGAPQDVPDLRGVTA